MQQEKAKNTPSRDKMNTSNYYSMGIDAHKHFCQVHILHPNGDTVWKGRINNTDYHRFPEVVKPLEGPCKAVFESSSNWHVLYDLLGATDGVCEVILAHPLKVKLICAAHLKNDKVDAQRLAQLLRLDMVPRAHATGPESRAIKELVRQRAAWVGMRTRIRNRTHRLLGAVPEHVKLPQATDVFGGKSLKAMRSLKLPAPFDLQLRQNLGMLEHIGTQTGEIEKELQKLMRNHPDISLLATEPGLGKVLACVIAAEVDGTERFPKKSKFIAYCGLAPTTKGSAGISHQGRMIQACNKWLKWAFIEGAWVAMNCDGYLGGRYKRLRTGGKPPNTAITNVARRMAQIAWEILWQRRPYQLHPPQENFPRPL